MIITKKHFKTAAALGTNPLLSCLLTSLKRALELRLIFFIEGDSDDASKDNGLV